MRIRTKITAAAAAASLAGLGFAGMGGTAFAATPTTCATQGAGDQPNSGNPAPGHPSDSVPGGDCAITGTVTLNTALSLATDITAFNLNGNALNSPSGAGEVVISSNDSVGYYLSEAGPASGDFTDTAVTPNTNLPEGSVSASKLWGGNQPTSCAGAEGSPTWVPLSPAAFSPLEVDGAVSGTLQCATDTNGATGDETTPQFDDSFDLAGWELTTVNGAPGGTYQGTVQLALWGE